ncbi:MAG: PH domain-containing protein, partial [Cyanobacteria bacterium P01_D01_bin.6]
QFIQNLQQLGGNSMAPTMLFKAPWSTSLWLITGLTCGLLIAIALIGLFTGPRNTWFWLPTMVGLPLVILVATAFFCIRGYAIAGHTLTVQRLGWESTVELRNLISAEVVPTAMDESLRLFGNGGLFAFSGKFRNQALGKYTAYATNPRNSVVLKFPQKTVVLTPDDPKGFVEAVLATQSS